MHVENPSLVCDLIEWVDRSPRPYDEVMEAWRTSCPRLTVWEDALDNGLIARCPGAEGQTLVFATARGRALLADRRGTARPSC